MAKKSITLPVVSMLANDPDKVNAAEMGGPKRHKRGGKSGRKTHDPQAAMLNARKKQFGTVAPSHEDATEQRKDRAVEAGGEAWVDGQRVRRVADPLETLFRKGRLAPAAAGDKREHLMNAVLYHAGTRYRERWYGAGLTGVAAQDLTRDIVDGSRSGDDTSLYASACAADVREVARHVGPRLLPYLDGLVVEEKPVTKLAGAVSDTKSRVLAEAIAMERVREALHRVAEVFRLAPDTKARPISAATGDALTREARPGRTTRRPLSASKSDVTAGIGSALLQDITRRNGVSVAAAVRAGLR